MLLISPRGLWSYCACACFAEFKWPTMQMVAQCGSAVSLKRGGFRENPTKYMTYVARWVCDSIFKTNKCFWSELPTNRHTHRTTTVTLAAYACRRLIISLYKTPAGGLNKFLLHWWCPWWALHLKLPLKSKWCPYCQVMGHNMEDIYMRNSSWGY